MKRTSCRGCGCTDERACPDGCWWIEPGLCSACAGTLHYRRTHLGGRAAAARVDANCLTLGQQAGLAESFGFVGSSDFRRRSGFIFSGSDWTAVGTNSRWYVRRWPGFFPHYWKKGPRTEVGSPVVRDLRAVRGLLQDYLFSAAGFPAARRAVGAVVTRLSVRFTDGDLEAGPVFLFAAGERASVLGDGREDRAERGNSSVGGPVAHALDRAEL